MCGVVNLFETQDCCSICPINKKILENMCYILIQVYLEFGQFVVCGHLHSRYQPFGSLTFPPTHRKRAKISFTRIHLHVYIAFMCDIIYN
jgi:hypothetical protein